MPTRNVARYLGRAISSVLAQEDVDLELIVVDDASEDDTARVISSFRDARIRMIRNPSQRGIAYCHNQILAASRAPFISHVDSDDALLPGALAAMLRVMHEHPEAGQAHSPQFYMDEDGRTTLEQCRHWYRFWARRRPLADYRRSMLSEGMVANSLRTYRRAALESLGGFDESLPYAVDWEMSVRMLGRFEIVQAPYPLYMTRLHRSRTSHSERSPALDHWRRQLAIALSLRRRGEVQYLSRWRWNPIRRMTPRLLRIFDLHRALPVRALIETLRSRTLPGLSDVAYRSCRHLFGWWPVGIGRERRHTEAPLRVGYYLWRYPSTTFVKREVEALSRAGIDVRVFADSPGSGPAGGSVPVHYRLPENRTRVDCDRRAFRRSHPIRYANLFWFTMTRRYAHYKSFREDRSIFEQAVSLAGMLRREGISHLHSPWADRSAFVCLLASRLLGIPYSVQARAHELYRHRARFALREKFSAAHFIVTNAHYNEAAIRRALPPRGAPPLRVVHEGLPRDELSPRRISPDRESPVQILCVARLIEEKGLVHLLEACRRLRERGFEFHATVIGGFEEPTYTRYRVDLMRLHRRLGLEDLVRFEGAQPFERVRRAYAEADVFVLPCVEARNGGRDVTPNTLIEAMAAGLPVISTRTGAIGELVEHGQTGLLLPPGDDEALASALAQLLQDPDLARKLGSAGRERMERHFDIDQNIRSYVSLFRGIA